MFSRTCGLLTLALAPLVMLVLALGVQFAWGWDPCTMCVEIRFLLAACSLAGFLGLALPPKLFSVALIPMALLGAGAAYLNVKLVLLEQGVLEAFSCSPFPFYSQVFPLQTWLPEVFMSGGICGQNNHQVLGVSFTVWTMIGISLYVAAVLNKLFRTSGS